MDDDHAVRARPESSQLLTRASLGGAGEAVLDDQHAGVDLFGDETDLGEPVAEGQIEHDHVSFWIDRVPDPQRCVGGEQHRRAQRRAAAGEHP